MANNKKLSNSFLIGIFILSGIALLVGFILWMGATQFFKEYDYYTTYFNESVQGLETGSSIKYLGVSCGIVDDVSVAPDGKLVQVILKIDKTVKITDDIGVQLEMAGLAGGKFLQLYEIKNKKAGNGIKIHFKTPYPVIPSATSSIGEITLAASNIIDELGKISWYNISDELTGTLEGTNKFLNNKELYLIVSELHKSTEILTEVLEKVNSSPMINDATITVESLKESAEHLNQLTNNLNKELEKAKIAEQIEKIYAGYDTTVKNTNFAIKNISNRVESSFMEVNSLLQEISITNKNLRKTLRLINESPYMFLTEPPDDDKIK